MKPQVSACSSGSFVILQVLTSASRAINFAEVLNDGADGLVKLIVRVVSAGSAQGLDVIECRAKPVLSTSRS